MWLDTVVVIGGFSAQFGWPGAAWFGLGAFLTSSAWFLFLVFLGRNLSGFFARPGVWRYFDFVIFAVMMLLAASLLWHTVAG